MSERDFVTSVLQLANLLTRRLAPVFEKAGVTPQQWGVLMAIAEAEAPLTLAGVARKMLVSKQNMTGMVARLEQLGLAERGDDPHDLRSSRVQLTRRGKALVERLRPAYDAWQNELGTDASPREIAAAARTLEKLLTTLERGPQAG